jgi:putative ABC transport system substrate-binding protein
MRSITRNILCFALIALLFAWKIPAEAQQPAKMPRIGILGAGSAPSAAFLQGLETLGYIPGKNVIIEYRSAPFTSGQYPELVSDLVRMQVDVIYASSGPAISAAKRATNKIPIVMDSSADPVEAKLVQSLARPGGNITGVGAFVPQLSGKMLELLIQAVPGVSRVGILSSAAAARNQIAIKETETAARALQIELQYHEIHNSNSLGEAFSTLTKARVGAVELFASVLFSDNEKKIVELATTHRLPAIYWRPSFAERGGLMSYGPSVTEMARRAGVMVGKILKGSNPAELPIERPIKFDLVLNLKTAKTLGITIPPEILVEATRVIH